MTTQAVATDAEKLAEGLLKVAAWLEDQSRIATNSLHCGDNSLTIARTHKWATLLDEAAKTLRRPAPGPADAGVRDDEDLIKYMVDRFLGWKLPEDFNPDNGISCARPNYAPSVDATPTGTNLFTAEQAEAMVRYMVAEPSKDAAPLPTYPTALLVAFEDHYWDTFQQDRELILQHVRSVMRQYEISVAMARAEHPKQRPVIPNASAERVKVVEGWQPIETAPKDGTPIDLHTGNRRWCNYRWDKEFSHGGAWSDVTAANRDWRDRPFMYAGQPTHWMPLPLSPDAGTKP